MAKELQYKHEKRHEKKEKSKKNIIYNQKHIRSKLKKIEDSEKKRL